MTTNISRIMVLIGSVYILVSIALIFFSFRHHKYLASLTDGPIFDLVGFLDSILTRCKALSKSDDNIKVHFVLNDFNDLIDPYYSFIKELLIIGCSIVYSSDRAYLLGKVDELKIKLLEDNDIKHNEAINIDDMISKQSINKRIPRGENICFIISEGNNITLCFNGFRSNERTIGGAEMDAKEAADEYIDLLKLLADPQCHAPQPATS